MSKKILIIALLLVVALVILLWRPWQEDALPVWLVRVEKGPVEASVSNTRTGTIKACQRSKLSMPVGGTVAALLVDEGDQVVAGQLLLELWNEDQKAVVAQAEQQLLALQEQLKSVCVTSELKEREAARLEKLLARKLTSEEAVDSARTEASAQETACTSARYQSKVQQATLDLSKARLDLTQLRAPFPGVIAEINGEVGEYITPSPPGIPTPAAVDLIDYSCLYVTAPIDEIDAAKVGVGMPARVTLDAFRGRSFGGKVSRIAPYVLDLEKQARTVDVDVVLDTTPEDVRLLVGYSADITVVLASSTSALRLPSEAILTDASVWKLDADHRLVKQPVSTGMGDWSYTAITKGLVEGDRVVRSPDLPGLEEGRLVSAKDD